MSFRKFAPYDNKREVNAAINYGDSRLGHSSGSSGSLKRGVYPQFSEPEDYRLQGQPSVSYQQSQNHSMQKIFSFGGKSSWNKPSESSSQAVNALPLYQAMPTSRQYMNETVRETNTEEFTFHSNQISSISGSQRNTEPFVQNVKVARFQFRNDCRSKDIDNNHSKNQKGFIGTRIRHMIGTVDQVTRWHKITKNSELEIIYEVAGVLENTINKEGMQLLLIRSETGHVLQGVFYPIDRELSNFQPGTTITATGNMIGSNKIHIFDANQINKDDLIAIQRLAFLSQRAMEENL